MPNDEPCRCRVCFAFRSDPVNHASHGGFDRHHAKRTTGRVRKRMKP